MSLTTPQLEELQQISEGIEDLFPDNASDQWWAAIRILNAGLGPVTTSPAAFDAVLTDIALTQGQIQPYQGKLASQDTGFREAVLQVVSGGGGGDNYFSADIAGTASRNHTITGVASQIAEDYTDGTEVGQVRKSAASMGFVSINTSPSISAARMVLTDPLGVPSALFGVLSPIGDTDLQVNLDGFFFDLPSLANQQFSITTANGGLAGLRAFDDDAAAGVGGLVVGDLYQTTGSGAAPLDAAGIVLMKQ